MDKPRSSPIRETLLAFVVTALVMAFLEWFELVTLVSLTHWQSQLLTVLIMALLAAVLARRLIRHHDLIQQRLQRQQEQLLAAHAALDQKNHFLKSLIRAIPDLVWMKDQDGCYLACNREFERFFGKPEEEILGKSDFAFMDRESAEFFRAHDQAAVLAGKPTVNEEWITYAEDGHRALLTTSKTPMYDNNGQLLGVLGIGHDITARRRQQQALEESQETLRAAQAIACVGSWRFSLASQQLECSEEGRRIFGLAADAPLRLQDFAACVCAEDQTTLALLWHEARHGAAYDVEHRIWVHGQRRWVRAQATLKQHAEDGAILIGTVQDITERKALEESLQHNLALVRAIIDASPVAMALNDAHGRIVSVNPAFVRTFGYQLEDIPTLEAWWPLAYPDPLYRQQVAQEWQEHLLRAQQSGQPFEAVEVRIRAQNGGERTVIVSAASLSGSFADMHLVTLFDITDRTVAEKALCESQQHYQALFASAPDAIFVADAASGVIVDANQQASRLLGRPLEALIGLHQSVLHPPEAEQEVREAFANHQLRHAADFAEPVQTHVVRADGQRIPVEISGCTISLEDRAVVLGVFRNVARFKQLEAAIDEKDAQYRVMLETLQDGYWTVDRSGKIIDVNAAYLRRSGYSRQELLDMSVTMLEAMENETDTRHHIERILGQGGDCFETWHYTKTGERWPVEITTAVLPVMGGSIVAFSRDMSQRKQEEERIRYEKEVHQQLAQLGKELLEARNTTLPMLCAMVLASCKKITRSPYGYVNVVDPYRGDLVNMVLDQGWLGLAGSTNDETVRFSNHAPPWGEAIRQRRAQLYNAPQQFDHFYGHTLPVFTCQSLLLVPVLRGEQVIAELAVLDAPQAYTPLQVEILTWIADIFAIAWDRFELERQLQHAIKMEAIGTLSAGIAHDFNNILGIILGYAELAQRKNKEPDEIYACLGEIRQAGDRAKGLVDQLLMFSRKKNGEHGRVVLAAIMREVEGFLRHSIPPSIHVNMRIRDNTLSIMGDAGQMNQLLLNLCTNAWQAIRAEQGRITVTLDRVTLNREEGQNLALPSGHYACLQVQDSGEGMCQEVLEHIFEPFYTTKDIGKGTGLGLSVVHGIVSGHHGAIHVESFPGKGSLFMVYLPLLVEEGYGTDPQQEVAVCASGAGQLLVVDDEEQILKIYEQMLTTAGYQVTAVGDAQSALLHLSRQPSAYAALITDQAMPGISGLELAARVKSMRADLPVLLCTGMGSGTIPEKERARFTDAVLYKPVPLATLGTVLQELLRQTKKTYGE
ncbi:MAG: PAS domain S-box protein [Magnetococcales bacterium]|nr:PAS domain S-box protein [Magnetococcales bacterium]